MAQSQFLNANDALSTLAGSISNTALVANLAVGTGTLFPNPGAGQYFVGTFISANDPLVKEIVWVTSRTGDTITMIRAQEGTTAENWTAGDAFQQRWTAGQAQALVQLPALQAQQTNYAQDTGIANAYVVGLTPTLTAPITGMPIRFQVANAPTGASTFNPGPGVAPLIRKNGTAFIGGEWAVGQIVTVYWNGLGSYQWDGLATATDAQASAGIDQGSAVTPAQLANASGFQPGFVASAFTVVTPSGWLECDASNKSRTTFANLFNAITLAHTVTLSIASPGVANWTAHPLSLGDLVSLETTGTLPTGLSTATNYYVLQPTANTFSFGTFTGGLNNILTAASWAATAGGQITATTTSAHGLAPGSLVFLTGNTPDAYNGMFACAAGTTGSTLVLTATSNPGANTILGSLAAQIAIINTSGSQTGTQTCRWNPCGCGDGSTTFTLPDGRGRTVFGRDAGAGVLGGGPLGGFIFPATLGALGGTQGHVITAAELAAHAHSVNNQAGGGNGAASGGGAASNSTPANTGSTGGNNGHTNTPPGVVGRMLIKT